MTGDSIGGVWTYCLDLSRALGNLGIEVVLLTMGRPLTREQHREAWSIPTLTVHEEQLKLEWMDDPWEQVDRAGSVLLGLERRYGPDLVHLNGYAHGVLPFRAPVLVAAHSCVLSWWRAVYGTSPPPEFDTYRERVRAGLRGADAVVAVTRSMLQSLEENYGSLGRTHVIVNGCDAEEFLPDQKEPFVFSAGRFWDAAKNMAALAEAAKRVRWPVYAAGDDQRPPGAGASFEPGNTAPLHMLGRLSRKDLAGWLGRAAIYALPARYEPFGLSVLEAALSGCALVLGDVPSLRELWDGAAVFVDADDSLQLASAINMLAAEAPQRDHMARAARERAARYSLRQTGEAYLTLYGEMVARGRQRAPSSVQAHP
jgi:glycosyltransferase involved in cell wall biosynthesis